MNRVFKQILYMTDIQQHANKNNSSKPEMKLNPRLFPTVPPISDKNCNGYKKKYNEPKKFDTINFTV